MAKWMFIALLALQCGMAVSAEMPKVRQEALKELVHQDCGSCHGMTLKGGLGPALIGLKEIGHSPESVAVTIREGRLGTPMPPWKGLLSENEIQWIVNYLLAYKEPK